MPSPKSELVFNKFVFIGIALFVVLFAYASTLYPGGSQHEASSQGFSWIHNYWCNLMNSTAMNGQPNPARPIAITAMIVLCTSLSIFFVQFARYFAKAGIWYNSIRIGGVLSMVFAVFMFSEYHDLMTLISSFFGLFAVLGIIRSIFKSDLRQFKVWGFICIALLLMNNIIYYTQWCIEWLPLLQKLTFLMVLGWVASMNYWLRQSMRKIVRS